ncbi:MAG: hypothetical protein ACRDMX_10525 [Solirubrobacteraceae bacterium]
MTVGIGLLGSYAAGLFGWYVLHRHGGGIVLAVVFSMILVWLYRRSGRGRSQRI